MDADAFITPLDADIDHSIQALYAVELRACHILFARSTPLDTDTEYSIHRSTWSDAEIEYSIGSLYVGCGYRMFDSSLYVVGCGNRIFDWIALRWMRIPNVRFIALRGRMRKPNIRFDRSTLDADTECSIHRSTWSDAEIEYSIRSLYAVGWDE